MSTNRLGAGGVGSRTAEFEEGKAFCTSRGLLRINGDVDGGALRSMCTYVNTTPVVLVAGKNAANNNHI